MFINRRAFKTTKGAVSDLVKLLMEVRGDAPIKIYSPYIGPFDTIVLDFEFESLDAFKRFWDEFNSSPENVQFMAKWYTLVEPGGTNELWEVW